MPVPTDSASGRVEAAAGDRIVEWGVTTFVDYVRTDSFHAAVSSGTQTLTHTVTPTGGISAGNVTVWVGVWVVRIRATIAD